MTALKLTVLTTLALCCLGFGQDKSEKAEAKPLSKDEWNSYFGVEHRKKNRIWNLTINAPALGETATAKAIEKFKGEKDGWIQLASVVVGGPMAGQQSKRSFKITEKGQVIRKDDKEIINIPFPLTPGQTWKRDGDTVTFDRFDDYETPTQTIAKCIVLISRNKKETSTRWFSPDHGSFFAIQKTKSASITYILEDLK